MEIEQQKLSRRYPDLVAGTVRVIPEQTNILIDDVDLSIDERTALEGLHRKIATLFYASRSFTIY
jgi:hypothetical protein